MTIQNIYTKGFRKGYEQATKEAVDVCAVTAALLLEKARHSIDIDRVIFNEPATVVFWKDGTKTVVKADGEDYDPEKGLAMAISKKALGNGSNYYEVFKEYLAQVDEDAPF